jgi:NitT/TauT family transport system ATP-binding protein
MNETIIEGRKLEKFYGDPGENVIQVIAPTDISVHANEIFAVLGPSGSGKSTLLRMLTGLSKPSAGEVLWHGNPVADQTPNVSIVFQSFALFPWLTVLENVEAPLKARGIGEIPRRKRSLKILETVGLDGFEGAYPKELSGGMKQRVGFARALVVEPEVLFMDEPFSALDVLTAENLRTELLELWANKSIPTRAVYIVTHNIEEAVLLADRIVVLGRNPGRIRTDFQVGLAQPRDRKSPAFLQIVDYVYKVLTQPDAAPQIAPDGSSAPAAHGAPGAPRAKYPMLPHARPGGISGMLEILYDRDGHDDIYHLADDLSFEIDDVLPIVEASSMLGFVHVSEGDVELTPDGRHYVDSDIAERKEIFAKAALERVTLVRQIKRALESKANHTLPDEFFHDTLDEHFSEQETVQQLETAVNWGRYAGLFDYDAATRKFYIEKDVEEEAASR